MRHCLCFGRIMKVVRFKNEQQHDETNNDQDQQPKSTTHNHDITTAINSPVNMNAKLEPSSDSIPVKKDVHANNNVVIFSYRELATATNNFRQEAFIGEGGFGPVYKGQLETTGQIVAVKQLNHSGLQGDKEFLVEVLMLSHLRHPNLVHLIGYCSEGDQRLLVYEYMPHGSLEDHLHELTPEMDQLDWNTRIKIAAGAANGLNFLHNEANPPVIYRDLKTSNILLGEGFRPRLSDFGLAKFGPDGDKSHVSTRVMGTQGYCAPEYAGTGKLTMKSDIYTFGVVLLELITGMRALDMSRGHGKHMLVDWARPMLRERKTFVKLADPHLKGEFSEQTLCRAVEVAIMCVREDPHSRPNMTDVVHALNYLTTLHYDRNKENGKGEEEEQTEDVGKCNKDSSKIIKLSSIKKSDRELAVAEAKMWGKTCREKMLKSDTDDLNR